MTARCACGRFAAVPEVGGQVADGVWHLERGAPTCEVAHLRSLLIEARDALRAIEARHVEANARHGRPEAESGTLALARGVLARIQAEVGNG